MPWRVVVLKSSLCAKLVVDADVVAAAPDPVATPLLVVVKMDVPAMLSMDEVLALVDGSVTDGKANVLNRGF